jgi:nicotinamide-nucleotide amidase
MTLLNPEIEARAAEVLAAARAAGVMIATAESCTGGLISGALTAVPGSSRVMDRGFVTYSNAAKQEMLGVTEATLRAHGAVSEATAAEMAAGALARSEAGLAVAVTGVAGPGASGPKPEGMVCFALAAEGRAPRAETVQFGALGRTEVRAATLLHALALLHADL